MTELTMPPEESMALADALLRDAGWAPIANQAWRNGFVMARHVGGVSPGGRQYVKGLDIVRPGDPRYGPDTPDEHHEAAAWLVEHVKRLEGDEAPDFGAEMLAAESEAGQPHIISAPSMYATATTDGDLLVDADFAEFGELPAPEVEEAIASEAQPEHQDRFYGLDDIDRRKTVAIGLVMRHAKALMPWWTTDHDIALRELRNFAMGVAEGRWPDDPARQIELNALEMSVRRIAEIEQARDAKVAFIEAASREDFDTFVVEADWP